MDIIKFDNLFWLRKFNKELQRGYKKMFYPNGKDFTDMWQMYVDNYYQIKEIGINIPNEMEYPSYFDCISEDIVYEDFTQYYKEQYNKFCKKIEDTISIINDYLSERSN